MLSLSDIDARIKIVALTKYKYERGLLFKG